MNNQEYITSGILELYAAGGLTEEERLEVERMAAASPEVRAALKEACAVMEKYALLHAVEPDSKLKAKVMQQVMGESPMAIEEREEPGYPVYKDFEKEGSPYKWMFAASLVLFLLSGFMSYRFYENWQEAESRLAVALASEQTLAQNYKTTSFMLKQQNLLLDILHDENFKPVQLRGVDGHAGAQALVYWNPEEQQVYLNAQELPKPPAGKQYQLWALDQGKPIDAGMVSLREEEQVVQQMKKVKAAQAFAITLEPAGGSKNPTLEEMYVMGETRS